jgi:NDP-sugar pyrophosphorylase family protein
MAGLGSRFLTKGFQTPKPLINVNGQIMIIRAIESLGIKDAKYLFVISKNQYTETIKEEIRKHVTCEFIEIDYITEGPASSALLFEQQINNDEELIIANCDQIMEWDADLFLMNARCYDGAIVTYYATTDKNSYARIDRQGHVVEIREKQVISNISLNGIHYWKKGNSFINSARAMIEVDDRAPNGEFYVGPTYNYMIKENLKVGIYHIPNQMHHPVGVPEDLEKFLTYENSKT